MNGTGLKFMLNESSITFASITLSNEFITFCCSLNLYRQISVALNQINCLARFEEVSSHAFEYTFTKSLSVSVKLGLLRGIYTFEGRKIDGRHKVFSLSGMGYY